MPEKDNQSAGVGRVSDEGTRLKAIVNDPQFASFTPEQQKNILTSASPDLKEFNPIELDKVVDALRNKGSGARSPEQTTALGRLREGLGIPTMDDIKGMAPKPEDISLKHPIDTLEKLDPFSGLAFLHSFGKGLVKGGKEALKETQEAWKNIAQGQPIHENLGKMGAAIFDDFLLRGALAPVGGEAVSTAGHDWATGDKGAAAGGMAAAAFLSLGALDAAKPTKTAGGDAPFNSKVRQRERLAHLVGSTSGRFDAYALADTSQPLLRQSMQELGFETAGATKATGKFPARGRGVSSLFQPVTETATNPATGAPMEISALRAGSRRILDVVDHAVEIAHRPFDKIVGEFGGTPAGAERDQIANALIKKAAEYEKTDPPIAKGLLEHAQRVKGSKSLAEINDIKVHANKEIGNALKGTPGQLQAQSVQAAYAWKIAGDTIREFLYPKLQELSGVNLREYGNREAAMMQARDGVYRTYYTVVDPGQASDAARGYLGGLEEGSLYRAHILKKAARLVPTPAGQFNLGFIKGVGELGEGIKPEKVTVQGRAQKLLKGGAEPHKFQIVGGIPEHVMEGSSGTEAQPRFAGTEEVPTAGPSMTAAEKGRASQASQRAQAIGTTAKTVPESVMPGKQSGPEAQASKIGPQAAAVPERSFTGPATKKQSRWQFLTSSKGPTQETTLRGPGVMETTDPKMAADTLKRLKQYSESSAFEREPFEVREKIKGAIADLDDQLKVYAVYAGRKSPRFVKITPMEEGTLPKKGLKKVAAVGGSAVSRARQKQAEVEE